VLGPFVKNKSFTLLDTRCRTTLSGVLSALYDIPPTLCCDDPLIRKCDEFVKLIIRAGYPGNHLVEYFTWMRYLPAAISPWKRRANKIFEEYSALWMKLFREVEKKLVCLASHLLSFLETSLCLCNRMKGMRHQAW